MDVERERVPFGFSFRGDGVETWHFFGRGWGKWHVEVLYMGHFPVQTWSFSGSIPGGFLLLTFVVCFFFFFGWSLLGASLLL